MTDTPKTRSELVELVAGGIALASTGTLETYRWPDDFNDGQVKQLREDAPVLLEWLESHGVRLVPVEATEEMRQAGEGRSLPQDYARLVIKEGEDHLRKTGVKEPKVSAPVSAATLCWQVYNAMLSASPFSPKDSPDE